MSNETIYLNYRRTARILTVVSGLLFSVFSIVWLYVFQKDVLRVLHYSLSMGKTQFSPLASALFITGVLLLLRRAVNFCFRLKGPVRALAWFPSFLALGILTDIDYSVCLGGGIDPLWGWLLPLLLGIFVLVALAGRYISRLFFEQPVPTSIVVNGNLLIFVLLCFMTVGIGNTDIHFHHELSVETALYQKDPAEARRVGFKTMDPGRTLTALRAYVFSIEGTMGEHLFRYPQLYGVAGLLLDASDPHLFLTPDSLYGYIGDSPRRGEGAVDFFERICREETGSHAALDYYLSALLLDRRLDRFVSEFDSLYTSDESVVPHYYREALFLYDKLHPSDEKRVVEDEAMENRWQEYEALCREVAGTVGEGNRVRSRFGDTYWWYYQYP